MSDQLIHYGVKGMRRGTRKSREERNAERRAKYEAKLKAKYGDSDIGKIETYLKIRKEHAEKVKKWRQANQRNRQLTATERREKYYGELDRGKLGKTYSTDATLAEAARKFYKKGHNKRMSHSELMHFGVKGMRWGVRKQRVKDAKRWTSKKQAKIDGMSDDQLKKANNRLRLEKEYRQLTQTKLGKYRKRVEKAAEEAAFNTLQNALQKGLKKAASQGGSAAFKGAKRFKHSETGMSSNIFFIDEDEVLAHHGVKGMRWGVRKQRPSGGAGPSKKRKGLSRNQKRAIAGALGLAAGVGAGIYLQKSGNGKKQGAAAKKFAQGKGRNLGAQARVKKAQAKRFAKAQSATAKGAAEKLKQTKAGKYAEATRLGANAAKFKAGAAARSAGYKVKNQAWKAGNSTRNATKGGASGVKSAAGSAARAAKSKFGKKAPSKALSTAVRSGGAGRRKLAVSGTKVVGRGNKTLAKNLAKIGAVGVGAHATGVVAGRAAAKAAGKKLESTGKRRRAQKRR